MIVIGLTGSIGMGKTTVARQLELLGAKVCSADAIVHALLKEKHVVKEIEKQFPSAVKQGAVDRKKLGEFIFNDEEKRHALEDLLHPLVVQAEEHFIEQERRKGIKMIVLEIPLLYETGAEERCDLVLVASAPYMIQKQRVMKRATMTEKKFAAIVDIQMPDKTKCLLADRVIPTGLGKAYSFRALAMLIKDITR